MMHMRHISTFNGSRTQTSYIAYVIFIIIGVAVGSFITLKYNVSDNVWIHQGFLSAAHSTTIYKIMKATFLSLTVFVSAAFFIGLSAVGQPFGLAMLIYRGIGIGTSVTAMYTLSGKSAVVNAVILIVPKVLAVSAISILAVREAVRSSNAILNYCMKKESRDDRRYSIRLYGIRLCVLILLSLLISAADGGVNYLYSAVAGK